MIARVFLPRLFNRLKQSLEQHKISGLNILTQKRVVKELVECLYSVLPPKQREDLDDSQRSDQLDSLRMPWDLLYQRLVSLWFVKIILPSEWTRFCRVFATPL